ncbi:hypothetical protein [Alkalimonas amylolytica]|uniref:Tetratricopeptide repeat-containing protein n=1 Tax=Alkalimonas amylolytica TaxID=152573 RepID=A0A1H4CKN4_ALKAM|nr:hypothetical protein [Alkalimonas amylolytica]SEA60883.1 Tetratricopeptide repeat-containing protein [Alkalimonas amylolytica]
MVTTNKLLIAAALCWVGVSQAAQAPLEQARQLLEQQDYQQVQQLLQPLQRSLGKQAEFWYLQGRAAHGLQDTAAAEKHLKKAAELQSDQADYQFWYGQSSCNQAQNVTMLRARGFAIRCRDAFAAAAALEPENLTYQRALAQFHIQAPSIAGGDKKEALSIAQRVRQWDALQGDLLELEVHVANQDQAAFEALVGGSELLQARPEPFVLRGMYQQRQGSHEQAISEFEQATQLSIDPDDKTAVAQVLTAWYQLGRSALVGKTQLEKGIAALQHYRTQLDTAQFTALPDMDWADLRLAQLYLLQDETELALALLEPLKASSQEQRILDEISKLSL